MRILDFDDIRVLIRKNELRAALEEILIISRALEFRHNYGYSDEIENILGNYNKNLRDYRSGIISRNEFNLEENKIRLSIIEIINEITGIPEINRILRKGWKLMMVSGFQKNKQYIRIDYSEMTNKEINEIEFPFSDYVDFGDLINGIYIKMSAFASPFSYDKEWRLVDDKGLDIVHFIIENVKRKRSVIKKIAYIFRDNNKDIYRLPLNRIQNYGIVSGDKFIVKKI